MAKERVFSVIGLGIFGMKVCQELSKKGAKVLAIDNHEENVNRAKNSAVQAILLDTTNPDLLREVPFQDVDVAIVAIGDNIEASILSTATLKELGIPRIISRAVSPLHSRVLNKIGADEVIIVEEEMGSRIASQIISPDVLDRIPVAENVSIAEIAINKSITGLELSEMEIRKKLNLQICGVIRKDVHVNEDGTAISRETFVFPDDCGKLRESDTILVAGNNDQIDELTDNIS